MSEPRGPDAPAIDENLTPRAGCWLFLLPVLLGLTMIAGYFMVFVYGVIGHPAAGPRVSITWTACPAAADVVKNRVEAMGLGDPVLTAADGEITLTATLPADEPIAAAIPATLAKTGAFSAVDVESAAIIVDGPITSSALQYGVDAPETIVQLDPDDTATLRAYMEQHPSGHVSYRIDGVEAFTRANIPAEAKGMIEMPVYGVTVAEALVVAAERNIVLGSGTLPCPMAQRSVIPQ